MVKVFYGLVFAVVSYGMYEIKIRADERLTQEKAMATAFYHKHNCRPLGYVANKYNPIRTYQCDNGVFIWDHMK